MACEVHGRFGILARPTTVGCTVATGGMHACTHACSSRCDVPSSHREREGGVERGGGEADACYLQTLVTCSGTYGSRLGRQGVKSMTRVTWLRRKLNYGRRMDTGRLVERGLAQLKGKAVGR